MSLAREQWLAADADLAEAILYSGVSHPNNTANEVSSAEFCLACARHKADMEEERKRLEHDRAEVQRIIARLPLLPAERNHAE